MFLTVKHLVAERVFQKNSLENIFGIGLVFQMQQAKPPDSVGMPPDGLADFLFTSHGEPGSELALMVPSAMTGALRPGNRPFRTVIADSITVVVDEAAAGFHSGERAAADIANPILIRILARGAVRTAIRDERAVAGGQSADGSRAHKRGGRCQNNPFLFHDFSSLNDVFCSVFI